MAKKPTATSTAALLQKRLQEIVADKERREAALHKLQEKLRGEPGNPELRAKVNDAKAEIGRVCDEHGTLARAVSAAVGGTNHAPL